MFKHSATLRNKQRCLAEAGPFVQSAQSHVGQVSWHLQLVKGNIGRITSHTLYHLPSTSDFIICYSPEMSLGKDPHPVICFRMFKKPGSSYRSPVQLDIVGLEWILHSEDIYRWNFPFKISLWLFNIAMENPQNKWRFLAGKSSVSMGHGFHGELFVITRG